MREIGGRLGECFFEMEAAFRFNHVVGVQPGVAVGVRLHIEVAIERRAIGVGQKSLTHPDKDWRRSCCRRICNGPGGVDLLPVDWQ